MVCSSTPDLLLLSSGLSSVIHENSAIPPITVTIITITFMLALIDLLINLFTYLLYMLICYSSSCVSVAILELFVEVLTTLNTSGGLLSCMKRGGEDIPRRSPCSQHRVHNNFSVLWCNCSSSFSFFFFLMTHHPMKTHLPRKKKEPNTTIKQSIYFSTSVLPLTFLFLSLFAFYKSIYSGKKINLASVTYFTSFSVFFFSFYLCLEDTGSG